MCRHTKKNRQTGPIFRVSQYRCVGSSHLGPQTGQKVSVCWCHVRLRARLIGDRGWGQCRDSLQRAEILRGEWENISMVINQNFGDTNDQKQQSILYPCPYVPSAQQSCPTHLRRCPIGYQPASLHLIGLSVPWRNRNPISANWAFVIAQSFVELVENET